MVSVEIIEFAKQHGYATARYLCDWRGYKCYELCFSEKERTYTGLPYVILEDSSGGLRVSTEEESMTILMETT